jgi:HK97 family phage major capsid protein
MASTLLGYEIAEMNDMQDNLVAGNLPLAFGDFKAGYQIVDRVGIRVIRDVYTQKPYVEFYTTKRTGGAVKNFEAIKLLKIKA